MMYVDSYLVERLKKLIDYKRKKMEEPKTPNFVKKILQGEIMLLQNDILPEILNNTMIIHSEITKYVIKAVDTAYSHKCNGLLVYIPINENYTDRPMIGIANARQNQRFGTSGAMEIYAEIINTDGNGAKPQPINLHLDPLMQ